MEPLGGGHRSPASRPSAYFFAQPQDLRRIVLEFVEPAVERTQEFVLLGSSDGRTLDNVLVLGVIVLIRTVLSISLDIEIDGVAPWRRRALESGATKTARAVREGLQHD